MPFLYLAT